MPLKFEPWVQGDYDAGVVIVPWTERIEFKFISTSSSPLISELSMDAKRVPTSSSESWASPATSVVVGDVDISSCTAGLLSILGERTLGRHRGFVSQTHSGFDLVRNYYFT